MNMIVRRFSFVLLGAMVFSSLPACAKTTPSTHQEDRPEATEKEENPKTEHQTKHAVVHKIVAQKETTPNNTTPATDTKMATVSHRGARADNTENTMMGFKKSLKDGADMLEVDVQVTLDDVAVLYHPADLKTLTKCSGKIQSRSYADLKKCMIHSKLSPKKANIPTLEEMLRKVPAKQVILDLKSGHVEKLIDAIAKTLDKTNAWSRVIFYSTHAKHLHYLKSKHPKARFFQDRDSTRSILLNMKLKKLCTGKLEQDYIGFELKKEKLEIVEKLTLGTYQTEVENVLLFDEETVRCIKSLNPNAKIFLFGINTQEDYNYANKIGAHAVFADSIKNLKR